MINMRENSSFDVEGTKKKIRNFLRQEISKRPELVKRWNEVMEGDVDSYDDYGELTYIESIFKNYKDNHKIEYEPDTNTFNFFIPLNCKRIDEYRDWSTRDAIAEEMQEEGKKYFGTEAFKCSYGGVDGWIDSFKFELRFGNSYLTPKRKLNQVIKLFVSDLGNLVYQYDTQYDKGKTARVYIYNKTSEWGGPRIYSIWWEINGTNKSDPSNEEMSFTFNLNNEEFYSRIDSTTTVKGLEKEMNDYFFKKSREEY